MKISLFIPCYIDQFYPQVGIATLELLRKLGCTVEYPIAQTCCGQPMANSGCEPDAASAYRHFVETFSGFDYIVAPSGSCVYHVRHHYDIIEQTHAVRNLRERTLDLTEFLLDILNIKTLNAKFPYKVGFHQSCHGLRGLHLGRPSERMEPHFSKPRTLLGMVEGIELVDLDRSDECCGFGGTFAVSETAVSAKMGKDRIADHIRHGAEVITAGDTSCLMHLEGLIRRNNLNLRTMHLAEILNSNTTRL